jgi:hypothetical protein
MNTQVAAALHARMQRVEGEVQDTRRDVSELSREQGEQGTTLRRADQDVSEIRADVRWMRDRMVQLLAVIGVAQGVGNALLQYWLGRH